MSELQDLNPHGRGVRFSSSSGTLVRAVEFEPPFFVDRRRVSFFGGAVLLVRALEIELSFRP
jgi:hypothetical protein